MKVRVILDPEGRQGTYENALRVEVPIPGASGEHISVVHADEEFSIVHHINGEEEAEIIWSTIL